MLVPKEEELFRVIDEDVPTVPVMARAEQDVEDVVVHGSLTADNADGVICVDGTVNDPVMSAISWNYN